MASPSGKPANSDRQRFETPRLSRNVCRSQTLEPIISLSQCRNEQEPFEMSQPEWEKPGLCYSSGSLDPQVEEQLCSQRCTEFSNSLKIQVHTGNAGIHSQ